MAWVLNAQQMAEILQTFNLAEGEFEGAAVETRRLAHMKQYFENPQSAPDDTVIYSIFAWPDRGTSTDLLVTITVLYPGQIGAENFHTKGHFHNEPDGPEFVVGYQGVGELELGERNGAVSRVEVSRGTHVWVPAGTAHRMVNRSAEPVAFLSISSAAVGHDYESVAVLNWKH